MFKYCLLLAVCLQLCFQSNAQSEGANADPDRFMFTIYSGLGLSRLNAEVATDTEFSPISSGQFGYSFKFRFVKEANIYFEFGDFLGINRIGYKTSYFDGNSQQSRKFVNQALSLYSTGVGCKASDELYVALGLQGYAVINPDLLLNSPSVETMFYARIEYYLSSNMGLYGKVQRSFLPSTYRHVSANGNLLYTDLVYQALHLGLTFRF